MDCYKWELEAILEGLMLKNVDEREDFAELAANLRYTIHSKKVRPMKLFNKKREERKVISLFREDALGSDEELAKRIYRANEHFRNKNNK